MLYKLLILVFVVQLSSIARSQDHRLELDDHAFQFLYSESVSGMFRAAMPIEDPKIRSVYHRRVVKLGMIYWINTKSEWKIHNPSIETDAMIRMHVRECDPAFFNDPFEIFAYFKNGILSQEGHEFLSVHFDPIPFDTTAVDTKTSYLDEVQRFTEYLSDIAR